MYILRYVKDPSEAGHFFSVALRFDYKDHLHKGYEMDLNDIEYHCMDTDFKHEYKLHANEFRELLLNGEIFGYEDTTFCRIATSWSKRAYEVNKLISETAEITVPGNSAGLNVDFKETDSFRSNVLKLSYNRLGYISPSFRIMQFDYIADKAVSSSAMLYFRNYSNSSMDKWYNLTNIVDCILNNIHQFVIYDNCLLFPRYVGSIRHILTYTIDPKLLLELL